MTRGATLFLTATAPDASDLVRPKEPQDRVHPPNILDRAFHKRAERPDPDCALNIAIVIGPDCVNDRVQSCIGHC